jgi:hypothetical protein
MLNDFNSEFRIPSLKEIDNDEILENSTNSNAKTNSNLVTGGAGSNVGGTALPTAAGRIWA